MKPSLSVPTDIDILDRKVQGRATGLRVGVHERRGHLGKPQMLGYALGLLSLLALGGSPPDAIRLGTIIVVARDDARILMAADQLQQAPEKNLRRYRCKIFQVGPAFVAFSGLTTLTEAGHVMLDLVRDLAKTAGALPDLVRAIEGAGGRQAIERDARSLARSKPAVYQRSVTDNDGFLSGMVVAGHEAGQPVFYLMAFLDRGRPGEPAIRGETKRCPGQTCRGTIGYQGYHHAIRRFVTPAPPLWFRTLTRAQQVTVLAQVEIAGDPKEEHVGGGIDTIEIRPTGHRWLQGGETCQ